MCVVVMLSELLVCYRTSHTSTAHTSTQTSRFLRRRKVEGEILGGAPAAGHAADAVRAVPSGIIYM